MNRGQLDDEISSATTQLDRVLGFFPRVDSKASFLFAIDTGLIAIMLTNLQSDDIEFPYVGALLFATIYFALASLFYVYRCAFPHLAGGANSLIYFRAIARKTAQEYIGAVRSETPEQRLEDLLCQVWRNSEILTIKFDAVELAFRLTIVALAPWITFLMIAGLRHSELHV